MANIRESIVHAYGVADREVDLEVTTAGVGDALVRTCVVGPLRVLFSVLDAAEFGRACWEAHGEDPDWLRDVAQSHHAVLQAWSARADILPFRLPSLHAGEATLTRTIRARLPELTRALAEIHNRWEWGLKVFLASDVAPTAAGKAPLARTGRDYLLGRATAAAQRDQAQLRREESVQALHDAFSSHAIRAVVSPPHARALSGRPEPMLLNAAYLAPRAHRKSLESLADAWADRLRPLGLRVELTGPWPPYHFASLGEDEERGPARSVSVQSKRTTKREGSRRRKLPGTRRAR